jgi:glycosyltransferase involved in cell wall biosynthesis
LADLRILLWYWGRRGAGGQLTLALAEALSRHPGVEVSLAISAQAELRPALEALGLPTQALPTYASAAGFVAGFARLPWLAWRLRRQALAFRADAVVSVMTHLWTPLVAPGLSRAGLRYVPFIHDAEPHPGDPGAMWDWRLRAELGAATAGIALSDAVAAALRRRRPDLPLLRLPLGAHLPEASLTAPGGRDRVAGGPRFLLFGRMRAYKGLDLLRDAWPLLRACHPKAELLVVGEGDAEALAPGLSALPGVRVEARWLAEADIPPLIAAADTVVLPYREGSQSGVVSLAHALGVPVVVTPVGGLAEQARHGHDGVVARDMSAAALAEAMAVLAIPAERARLAAGAAETGRRLRDWDGIATTLAGGLRGMVDNT